LNDQVSILIEQGRLYLREYLEQQGVEFKRNGKFSCIHPDHDDNDPSASIIPRSDGEMAHCFGCLDEKEPIWTDRGLISIGDIEQGNWIITHTGTLRQVGKVVYKEGKLLRVKTKSSREGILVTPDHTMMVIEFKDLVEKVPYIYHSSSRTIGFVGRSKKDKDVSLTWVEKEAKDLSTSDFIGFPVSKLVIGDDIKWPVRAYTSGPKTSRLEKLSCSKETARFLGLYLAEGSTGRGYIRLTFNITERDTLAKEAMDYLESIGLPASLYLYPEHNTCEVNCSKTDLKVGLEKRIGKGAGGKRIPHEIFYWPIEYKEALLEAYLDGDGCRGDKGKVSVASISRKLALGVYKIAVDVGRLPSISRYKGHTSEDGTNHKEFWNINLKTREGLSGFHQKINGITYYISQIDSVEETKSRGRVVDISVPGAENSFLTSIGAVHNCGSSYDIYSAALHLEGKPILGASFLRDNLEYILEKFGIEHEKIELTEEQLQDIKYTMVYNKVIDTMLEKASLNTTAVCLHTDRKPAAKRGWSTDTCEELCIGTIRNYDKFIESVKLKTNLSQTQLEDMGITSQLFGPQYLTFAIRDHKDIPRGFVARFIPWKSNCGKAKYENTGLLSNPFYNKSKLLYGMDTAKKYNKMRLDIFEGYGSRVTAWQAGFKQCVSLGGTALTQDHVDLLYDLGFRHINLVLDMDETGRAVTKTYVERFSGYQGLKVTTMKLDLKPEELKISGQNDPDYFINTYGIEAYRKLRTIGIFEYNLQQVGELVHGGEEAIEYARTMVKLIVNEEDRIKRGQMTKALSAATGVDKDDLDAEVRRIEDSEVYKLKSNLIRKLGSVRDLESLADVITSTQSQLVESTSSKEQRYLISTSESIETWDKIFNHLREQKEGIQGWRTGYDPMDDMLGGIAKPTVGGVTYGIAGSPSHGKSAYILNLAYEIATRNKDVSVLYWAIDDSRMQLAAKLISIASGVALRVIKRRVLPTDEEARKIKEAQELIINLTQEEILVFKDDKFGRYKSRTENWIKSIQDSTGKDILLCIDSLHNVSSSSGKDERLRIKENSTWAKELCVRIPLTVVVSLEMLKNRTYGEKPTISSIVESGKIEYDWDVIAVVWNEVQGRFGNWEEVRAKWGDKENFKAIIELDFQKNKSDIGDKGSLFFHFEPETYRLTRCSRVLDGYEMAQATDIPEFKVKVSASNDGRIMTRKKSTPVLMDE